MLRICIVEDNPLTLSAIKAIVTDLNKYEIVATFNNAEDYLKDFTITEPDITLMDIELPGISGIEAVTKIKVFYPNTKIIMLTNLDANDKLFNALKAGADGYLLKRNSFERLGEALQEIEAGGAPITPEIAKKVIDYFSHHNPSSYLQELTDKEKLALEYLVDGLLYKEIADKMNLSIDSIKKYAGSIYAKLHVRTRSEAIKMYLS